MSQHRRTRTKVLAITYAVTTAASGDITEKVNYCVYCLPLMFGSQERVFTIDTRLAQFLCACALKNLLLVLYIKNDARPNSEGAARERGAHSMLRSSRGRSLVFCF